MLPAALLELRDPDIADVLNQMTVGEAAHAISHLPRDTAERLFDEPELRRRATIIEQLDPNQVSKILDRLSADERTDVLRRMNPHARHRLLPELSAATRAEAELLLRYPPKTAGGIMTTEFVRLDPTMSVAQALDRIRAEAGDKESIYACYVLEPSSGRLLGAVSLRDLIMANPSGLVAGVMRRHPISVGVHDPQQRVAEKISRYNLLAVPVLETGDRVAGFVAVDDVIDVLVEEETERSLRMGGVEPSALDQPYLSMPFWTLIRKRATWLVVIFLGEMLTATAMGRRSRAVRPPLPYTGS